MYCKETRLPRNSLVDLKKTKSRPKDNDETLPHKSDEQILNKNKQYQQPEEQEYQQQQETPQNKISLRLRRSEKNTNHNSQNKREVVDEYSNVIGLDQFITFAQKETQTNSLSIDSKYLSHLDEKYLIVSKRWFKKCLVKDLCDVWILNKELIGKSENLETLDDNSSDV